MSLTWSIVLATYKREHVLPRALRLAAGQSRPPLEIITIDASPNWQAMHDLVSRKVAPMFPHIRWVYEQAHYASSAGQRNQGVAHSAADLIFFIDDDSLMYPDCAEQVLRVFETDRDEKVAAVGTQLAAIPPDKQKEIEEFGENPFDSGVIPTSSRIKQFIRRTIEGSVEYLLPYDGQYPKHPIPQELADMHLGRAKTLSGSRMCVRRKIALLEPFENILHRYAYLEDSDMSYRASRHGLLLNCLDARICHLETHGGRLPPYVVALLGALNPVVLHAIYSSDKNRSRALYRKQLRRRMMFQALKDIGAGRWTLPATRGVRKALNLLDEAIGKTEQQLRSWYPQFQRELMDRHNSA